MEETLEAGSVPPCALESEPCECCGLDITTGCACEHCAHPRCSRCGRCEEHCRCDVCGRCNTPVETTCSNCDRCCECCRCSMSVRFVENPLTFHRSKTFVRNPSKRFISCELECEKSDGGSAINDVVSRWNCSVVKDGSLPSSGFEICTAPAQGDKFLSLISELTSALADEDAKVGRSCGYHVHVDARDFNYWDIRKLCILYAKIEPALVMMVPAHRQESDYCQPCGHTYLRMGSPIGKEKSIKDQLVKVVYDGGTKADLRRLKKSKYHDARYYALNLHSWVYRGTIECRLFGGTTNYWKITNWGILWAAILDFAYKKSEGELKKLYHSSLSPREVLLMISPTKGVKEFVEQMIPMK